MTQLLIALVGISGVGKTTFLKRLAGRCEFQHLTAGSVIARARQAEHSHDSLRFADLGENQRLLIEGFALARDRHSPAVVLDGHVVIDGLSGLTPISSQVFSALDIDLMAHLEAAPEQILANRRRDVMRDRPSLTVEQLRSHQTSSLTHAQLVSSELGIEFRQLTHADVDAFGELLLVPRKCDE